MPRFWLTLVLASTLASGAPLTAAQFVVTRTDDLPDTFPGDAVCAVAGGGCTLRAAVMEANADDVTDDIVLAADTYRLTLTSGPNDASFGDLDILNNLRIRGGGMRATVILAATGNRVFELLDRATLSDMTLRGGLGAGGGGGVRVAADVAFNCTRCVIRDNRSTADGGGVEALGSAEVNLSDSIVGSNLAAGCGGVASHGPVTIGTTQVTRNRAQGAGGGVCVMGSAGELNVSASTVNDNVAATNGGGVEMSAGNHLLSSATVSGNRAARGAGLHLTAAAGVPSGSVHMTVANNHAALAGGGVWIEAGSTLSLSNSILADNDAPTSPDCLGTLDSSAGHNLVESIVGCAFAPTSVTNGNVLGLDPELLPLANLGGRTPVHELASETSPAWNAGADGLLASDQRFYPRPYGAHPEIGATEFHGIVPVTLDVPVLEMDGLVRRLYPTMGNLRSTGIVLDGALSWLEGPAGATYSLVDWTGDYGLLEAGTARSCAAPPPGDCYDVRISVPSGQPAPRGHVDALTYEQAGPSSNYWRLHVGGTFRDTPKGPNHLTLQYWAIERLVHSQATAGCQANAFCPTDGLTRRQLALLLARLSQGEFPLPQVATGAVFADVPAGDPHAAWIERFAADGMATACAPDPDGAGPLLPRFCPDAPVRRAQLARTLVRMRYGAGYVPPACGAAQYEDVPAGDPWCPWIQAASLPAMQPMFPVCAPDPDQGGSGLPRFCPGHPSTRAQAAAAIASALQPPSWSLGL